MMDGTDAPNSDTTKSKTHWKEWEIGYLIDRHSEGVDLNVIADGMGRSLSACRTMLTRLILGEVKCSTTNAEALEKLREQNPPKATTRQAHQQTIEQYRQLAKNDEAMKAVLDEIETMLVFSLAIDLIDERITSDEIANLCPLSMVQSVQRAFGKISQYRRDHPDLFNKPPAPQGDAVQIPKADVC